MSKNIRWSLHSAQRKWHKINKKNIENTRLECHWIVHSQWALLFRFFLSIGQFACFVYLDLSRWRSNIILRTFVSIRFLCRQSRLKWTANSGHIIWIPMHSSSLVWLKSSSSPSNNKTRSNKNRPNEWPNRRKEMLKYFLFLRSFIQIKWQNLHISDDDDDSVWWWCYRHQHQMNQMHARWIIKSRFGALALGIIFGESNYL